MIKLLIKFWPALIPIGLFVLWRIFTRKKRKAEEEWPHWDEKLLMWTLVATLLVAIITISVYVLSQESNIDSKYVPPHYEDGEIVPGKMIPAEKESE